MVTVGHLKGSLAFEWYLHSGGQLKYYPLAKNAKWHSELFELEPLPTKILIRNFSKSPRIFSRETEMT